MSFVFYILLYWPIARAHAFQESSIDINFGRRFCGVMSCLAAAKIYSIVLIFSIKTRSCCYDEMPPVMIYGVYYFASDSSIERRM